MPKWIKLGLGFFGVCAACCALPLVAALLGGSALVGVLSWVDGERGWWAGGVLLAAAVAGLWWGGRRLWRSKPCVPAAEGSGAHCLAQKTGCACGTSP